MHHATSQKGHQKKEKEVKRVEAVVAEMRAEVNHMELANRKGKTKLRTIRRRFSEVKKAHRLAARNIARIQLYLDAILPRLLDD